MSFDEEETTTGSDDILSDDHLHLPENANSLVRLHAVRSWLNRKCKEAAINIGMTALHLQQLQQDQQLSTRPRRNAMQAQQEHLRQTQARLSSTQQLLYAYEEASQLLEDCVNHTTINERLLVEYYLTIANLVEDLLATEAEQSPRLLALTDVLHRLEQVGAPHPDD